MQQQRSILAFTLVVAITLLWGCARTPQEKEARFLALGKEDLQKKDYNRAILNFRNAVVIAPSDSEARYQLGWAFLLSGDLTDAAAQLRKAVELNPKHLEAQVKLAQLYALAGNAEAVKQGQERMLDILSDSPDNPDALTTLALADLRYGTVAEGEQHLRQALQKFPQHMQAAMVLARVKLEQRDYAAAEQVLKQAAQNNPQSMEAALGLAEFYRIRSRWNEAESQFQKVLSIDANNALALDGLAAVQLQAGHKDQAEQSYRRLATLPDKRFKHHHAAYLFQQGQRDAAIAEFAKLASQDPTDRDARTHLISAYLMVGRTADAEKVLATALKANPKDVDALLQRAQILVLSGKAEEGNRDLLQVLQFKPNAPLAHYLMARVHQAKGDSQQQRQELSNALRLQPDLLGVRIELSNVLLLANHAKAALDVMDDNTVPVSQKNTVAYITQRNWALLASGDLAELSKGVTQGLALSRTADLLLQGGQLELLRRNYAAARTYATEALERNPDDVRSLEILARTYSEQGQSPVALQKVREYAGRRPKSAQVQEYVGTQLQISGDRAGARNAFNAARAADPSFGRAELALATLDLAEGHVDEARKRAAGLVSSGKDVIPARLLLGDIETKAGNYGTAVEQYRKVLEVAPANLRALNNIAYLLVEHENRLDEALKYAQKAVEILPDNPMVEDTIGWVLYRKGVYGGAVKYLETAAGRSNLPVTKYHLAMAYLKAGQLALGRQTLDAALRMDPTLPEAQAAKQTLTETSSARK
jgi:tetratricopeptide (TPR) repeat protein